MTIRNLIFLGWMYLLDKFPTFPQGSISCNPFLQFYSHNIILFRYVRLGSPPPGSQPMAYSQPGCGSVHTWVCSSTQEGRWMHICAHTSNCSQAVCACLCAYRVPGVGLHALVPLSPPQLGCQVAKVGDRCVRLRVSDWPSEFPWLEGRLEFELHLS